MTILNDYLEKTIDNRGRNPQYLTAGKHPVIDNVLIKNNIYPDLKGVTRYIDDSTFTHFLRGYVHKNMPIMTLVGNGIGNVSLAPSSNVAIVQNTIGFQVKENLDEIFLYYYLLHNQERIRGFNRGSGQPSVRKTDILGMEVQVPEMHIQKKVASILFSLDLKIQKNNEINENLLQQITACFHHYFDEYEASSDSIGVLGDVAQFKYGTMPKKEKLGSGEYVAFSGYQVVGSYPEKMYSSPQLIVVARGVGGCGDIKYTPSNCYLTNLSIAILTQNVAIEDYLFNYLRLHDTKVMNTGSAQPQITVSTLEKYQLPIPPKDLLAEFSVFVQPFKSLYRKNKDETERLQILRDTLLPHLMSGELDVSDLDI